MDFLRTFLRHSWKLIGQLFIFSRISSRRFPGDVPEKSGTFLGNFMEVYQILSWTFTGQNQGHVPEISWKFIGNFLEVSRTFRELYRTIHGHFREISWIFPGPRAHYHQFETITVAKLLLGDAISEAAMSEVGAAKKGNCSFNQALQASLDYREGPQYCLPSLNILRKEPTSARGVSFVLVNRSHVFDVIFSRRLVKAF